MKGLIAVTIKNSN